MIVVIRIQAPFVIVGAVNLHLLIMGLRHLLFNGIFRLAKIDACRRHGNLVKSKTGDFLFLRRVDGEPCVNNHR